MDYGLIDNDHVNTVISFVINEDARYSCGSDHALRECILDIGSYSEAVHYNINDSTNYSEYMVTLDTAVSSIALSEYANLSVEEMLPHISENIWTESKS